MNEKIIEIKKVKGCAFVQLENGEKIRVPGALLRERPVKVGESIEPVLYREYIIRRGYPHAVDKAVKLLAMRDHSEGELRDKLYQAGYPDAVIDKVIEKLTLMELVDDEHFAEKWAQSRAHKHGRRRIEQELTHKGVDREVARRAVGNLTDEDQLQDAIRLVGKFLSRTHGDMDRSLYQRTLAMLARHGYDADIARKALMSIARGADAEE
ncbi:MAG: regulatory protein RecX [Clostridia bacterium]|nr:regulatory protein RecX [Clostridia bacterium]